VSRELLLYQRLRREARGVDVDPGGQDVSGEGEGPRLVLPRGGEVHDGQVGIDVAAPELEGAGADAGAQQPEPVRVVKPLRPGLPAGAGGEAAQPVILQSRSP